MYVNVIRFINARVPFRVVVPISVPSSCAMMVTYDFKKGCAFIDRDGTREETTDFIQAEPHKGEGSSVLCKLSGVVCKVRCIYWALSQYASEEQQETDVARKVPTNKSKSRQQRPTSAEHAHGGWQETHATFNSTSHGLGRALPRTGQSQLVHHKLCTMYVEVVCTRADTRWTNLVRVRTRRRRRWLLGLQRRRASATRSRVGKCAVLLVCH